MTENKNRYAKVQCALFKGTTRDIFIDRKEFDGPLYEQVDDAYQFILRHIDMGADIEGVYRNDVYELPIKALREMVANAIAHRSYLDNSCTQVSIYDDRVEVSSPGMLYGGLDIETAKQGKSRCRNSAIAEAFHYMHIIEAWGTGIPRIINRCKEYGLKEPVFEEFGDGFRVTIFRKDSGKNGKAVDSHNKKATIKSDDKKTTTKTQESMKTVLEYMEYEKEYALSEICKVLNLKPTRTKEILKKLINEDKVETLGENRNRKYRKISSMSRAQVRY